MTTALLLVAAPALLDRLHLDATQLASAPNAWPPVLAAYLLCAAPFAAGALVVLAAIEAAGPRPGLMYGASFAGSGLGALAALAATMLPPERALAVPGALAGLAALTVTAGAGAGRGHRAAGIGMALVATLALWRPPWGLDLTPYKELPQVEAFPDAERVAERPGPAGWVVAARAPAFRHAPGLSLAYDGAFPRQTGLFVDGHIAGAVSQRRDRAAATGLADWLPAAAPFAMGPRRHVLVVGAGDEAAILGALAHGADGVTVVDVNGPLMRLASDDILEDRRVRRVIGDARGFLARSPARYDLITIGPGGAFGATAAGIHALGEDFLQTLEGYRLFLARLAPGGVLAVTRWLAGPPREAARAILTAGAALRAANADVGSGLLVVRGWGTATVLAKPAGFTRDDLAALERWAAERQFDLDWPPAPEGARPSFNLLDDPAPARAAAAVAAGADSAARFADRYPFDVAPATDARPFAHHFLRLSAIGRMLRQERGTWLPFAEWGALALLATLGQSLVLGALLLAVPLLATRGSRIGRPRATLYFAAIGLAYLVAEIAAIEQLVLLLGNPVYAVAAVLAILLVGSGIGSLWSDRLDAARAVLPLAAVAALAAGLAVGLLPAVHAVLAWPLAARALVALVILTPLAVLMGMPFPLGLRRWAGPASSGLGWAWAVNGCASVVAAPLAALIALEAGSPAVFGSAAVLYAGAALATRDRS
jgi:hypothetical protein